MRFRFKGKVLITEVSRNFQSQVLNDVRVFWLIHLQEQHVSACKRLVNDRKLKEILVYVEGSNNFSPQNFIQIFTCLSSMKTLARWLLKLLSRSLRSQLCKESLSA
jgi:hypothetical protein